MVEAIVSFIIFAAIAAGVAYFVWKRSALKSDLTDDGIIK